MIPLNKNPKGLLFALCFFVLATLQMEAISWNPLQWFRGDDGKERRRQSYMASPEEQAIAQEMFKKAQDLAFAGKTALERLLTRTKRDKRTASKLHVR